MTPASTNAGQVAKTHGHRISIALAGNPNCGKTTVFNAITGARQHVGNYPGVTVEKKEGTAVHKGRKLHVVDLPGTYSLTAYTMDELVTRKFLLEECPDVVVAIVDSSNLERNLYLATQLLEMNVPVVLAFNMADVAKRRGLDIDIDELSQLLGVRIVWTVGNRSQGIDELLDAVVEVADGAAEQLRRQRHPTYGNEVEPHVCELAGLITEKCGVVRSRWMAVKLLEDDGEAAEEFRRDCAGQADEILARAAKLRGHIESVCGDSAEIILADRRYGFISGACTETVRHSVEARHNMSDKIDTFLTNRWLGMPIFVGLMYLVFYMTFTLGEAPMGWIESGVHWLGSTVSAMWPRGSESLLRSLLVDGIIAGVGGVVVFLPNIVLLFLGIAFLEDSGYMARAAFVMDRLMHRIGLHGRSFIPMMIGFGCSIPAIMATRTLETRRDRLTTMLVVPLMSCGARLPIYAMIIPAFFPQAWGAPILWSIYLIGIVLAILLAKLLRKTLFRGDMVPFLMELPPYRMPTLKGLLIHMWERAWLYLRKAGTVILAISIVLWALTTFPQKTAFDEDYDKLHAQAAAGFVQSLSQLNQQVGLPAKSQLIARAVQTELAAAEKQSQYWPHEDGYAAAEADRKAAVEKLTHSDGGSPLASFLLLRDRVVAVRAEFDHDVEDDELIEGTEDYATRLSRLELDMKSLELENRDIYPAVIRYLDEMEAEYLGCVSELGGRRQVEEMSYTVAGGIGKGMEPALKPLGFDWRIGTALIGAFAAKEVFVTQMGIVMSLGDSDEGSDALRAKLKANYTPLTGYCIMLFCLITAPCIATIVVTKRESGSWKWAMLQLFGLTVVAYIVTLVVYQVGSLFA